MPNQEQKSTASITLLSLHQVSEAIGFSSWTIDSWTRAGKFPRPLVAGAGSPRRWRLVDIENWIEARRRARAVKPAPRGKLRRGTAG
jgi:predicted DNA-binding transcriptional regulator AlpA